MRDFQLPFKRLYIFTRTVSPFIFFIIETKKYTLSFLHNVLFSFSSSCIHLAIQIYHLTTIALKSVGFYLFISHNVNLYHFPSSFHPLSLPPPSSLSHNFCEMVLDMKSLGIHSPSTEIFRHICSLMSTSTMANLMSLRKHPPHISN